MSQIPFGEIRAWMFEAALPFWAGAGLDHAHGGFHEELTHAGAPADLAYKRVRVACRQVYVFAHAALLGWREGEALAERGYRYLVERAWQGEQGGWARRLTRQGAVLDPTPDLYDQAFALFALAWHYRLTGNAETLARAHATLDFVHARMRPQSGEGFLHALPPQGPRLQNPHMHLLEASLAMFEASAEERFLDQADELVGLFRRRLFDGRTLGEYFNADWARLDGEAGARVEPGHHFEWAWILAQYRRLRGVDVSGEAAALVDFAERFGVDAKTQTVYDEVRADGAPLKRSSRTWPNTERIKGHLGLFELAGRDPRAPVAQASRVLLDRYLALNPRGLWIDQLDADGAPAPGHAPASSFYHLFLAFAEALRLESRLAA